MSAPVKIAVVGAGLIGKRHIEHIVGSVDADLHCVVDPFPVGVELAGKYGVPHFASIAEMLKHGKPDGVIVATPNTLHVPQGLEVINAGIPALIEKPIANDVGEAEMLVLAAEAAKIPLLTGHHRRHNRMIGRAMEIVESGRLGKLVSVHLNFWLMKPDDYFEVEWRTKKGAGPVLINLIHDVDLLRHLCGEVECVQAMQSNFVRNFEVDETTVITLRFKNGMLGTLNGSDTIVSPWNWEHNASEFAVYPRTDQSFMQIGGADASLSLPNLAVWSHEGKKSWWSPFKAERVVVPEENPLDRQITQFARVIRGLEKPLVSGREGLMTLKTINAIQRAVISGAIERV